MFEEILKDSVYDWTDTDITGVEKEAKKGVIAVHHFAGKFNGFITDSVILDKGKKQYLYEVKFIENKKSPKQRDMTAKSSQTDKAAPRLLKEMFGTLREYHKTKKLSSRVFQSKVKNSTGK